MVGSSFLDPVRSPGAVRCPGFSSETTPGKPETMRDPEPGSLELPEPETGRGFWIHGETTPAVWSSSDPANLKNFANIFYKKFGIYKTMINFASNKQPYKYKYHDREIYNLFRS